MSCNSDQLFLFDHPKGLFHRYLVHISIISELDAKLSPHSTSDRINGEDSFAFLAEFEEKFDTI